MKTGSASMIQSQSQSRPRGQQHQHHHHHHHEMRTSWAGAAAAAARSAALYLSCPRPGNELIRREAASKEENLLQLQVLPRQPPQNTPTPPVRTRAGGEQTEVISDRFDPESGLAHFREFIPPICSTAASQKLHEVNHHLLFFPVLISHFS